MKACTTSNAHRIIFNRRRSTFLTEAVSLPNGRLQPAISICTAWSEVPTAKTRHADFVDKPSWLLWLMTLPELTNGSEQNDISVKLHSKISDIAHQFQWYCSTISMTFRHSHIVLTTQKSHAGKCPTAIRQMTMRMGCLQDEELKDCRKASCSQRGES